MARYIDADELRKYWLENGINENVYNTNDVLDSIDYQPSADVVEVCRCGECRFNVNNMEKDGYDTTDYSGEDIVCSYFMTDGMQATDFCSYGKRREGEK